jgi:hypothetical protein
MTELDVVEVNVDNMRAWVAALRSGEFLQGRARLAHEVQTGDGLKVEYCCLGVACETAFRANIDVEKTFMPDGGILYNDARCYLPAKVSAWLGISNACPRAAVDSVELQVTYLNDSLEWDLDRIADAIETRYLPQDVMS